MASPTDMAQIKAIVTAIDTAPPTPTPKPRYPAEAVRVTQRNVKQVARAVAAEAPNVKVAISGSEILLSGPPDDVEHAKQLVAELDVPQMGTQYTQVYRLKYIDAGIGRRALPAVVYELAGRRRRGSQRDYRHVKSYVAAADRRRDQPARRSATGRAGGRKAAARAPPASRSLS